MIGKTVSLRRPLPPRRDGYAADEDLLTRRSAAPPYSETGSYEQVIAGVACRLIGETASGGAKIVHLHGGGYRLGSPKDWVGFGRQLATAAGAQVILPDYSLAPERPFPHAVHDVIGILTELSSRTETGPIILSGDSAGGGLALATAGALSPPSALAGLILISPWLDLRIVAESYERCAKTDSLFSSASAQASAADYLQGWSADDPLVSPLLGELEGLPPVCLFASSAEVLADDALNLARQLGLIGIPVTSVMLPHLLHDWPVMEPQRQETAFFFEIVKVFARQSLGLIA
jgi:acetyl esterase/lipase